MNGRPAGGTQPHPHGIASAIFLSVFLSFSLSFPPSLSLSLARQGRIVNAIALIALVTTPRTRLALSSESPVERLDIVVLSSLQNIGETYELVNVPRYIERF